MKIASEQRDRITLSTEYACTDGAMIFAVQYFTDAISCEGFPFKNFEIMLVASWYESKNKLFYYTFRLRWRD